jgi:DNA replication and repair protein RecF
MSVIQRLGVDRFRNLQAVDIEPAPRFNLLFGLNGSGKTSLLEAIHFLSVGKSFRTHKLDPLITDGESDFLLFADIGSDGRVGLSKSRNGRSELKLSGQNQRNWENVAASLPIQVINSESFSLLEGGAKLRRRFLDWAVFHVEHDFLVEWRAYRRCVSHKNILLKQKGSALEQQLLAWDIEIARYGEAIHRRRDLLIQSFSERLMLFVQKFLPAKTVEIDYKAGWDIEMSLADALRESRSRDLKYGMSLVGPHRADFVLRFDRHLATDVLSRGQLKMLVCAVKLAMGDFIQSRYQDVQSYQCIYLVDDLAAELDKDNRALVSESLHQTASQCFFTAVQDSDLPAVLDLIDRSGKFHVEHGKMRACNRAIHGEQNGK